MATLPNHLICLFVPVTTALQDSENGTGLLFTKLILKLQKVQAARYTRGPHQKLFSVTTTTNIRKPSKNIGNNLH
ncbi:hypothetical protein HHI36_012939 [Cryptolaemus montrouzieri]|uniref:Secreted protein n=1 Tax=Cryptolaemus montrouzieri TaxID=559131 RepID=A0ABD2NFW5_9CUCU